MSKKRTFAEMAMESTTTSTSTPSPAPSAASILSTGTSVISQWSSAVSDSGVRGLNLDNDDSNSVREGRNGPNHEVLPKVNEDDGDFEILSEPEVRKRRIMIKYAGMDRYVLFRNFEDRVYVLAVVTSRCGNHMFYWVIVKAGSKPCATDTGSIDSTVSMASTDSTTHFMIGLLKVDDSCVEVAKNNWRVKGGQWYSVCGGSFKEYKGLKMVKLSAESRVRREEQQNGLDFNALWSSRTVKDINLMMLPMYSDENIRSQQVFVCCVIFVSFVLIVFFLFVYNNI